MKKLAYLAFLLAVLGLIIAGCEKMHSPVEAPATEQGGAILWLPTDICGQPTEVRLLAGQNIPIGTVTVANNGVNLYVEYQAMDGWCMTETHLHVATSLDDIPQTKKGNPIPGKFEHKTEHDPCVTEYTYTILLNGWVPGTGLYIAAHAAVEKDNEAPYYASSVVDYEQGKRKDGSDVLPQRSIPEQGLIYEMGRDESNFFSLGFGGWIIVEFDCPIRNGEGDDVKVIEDTWGTYPLEEADVFASQDGVNWTYLGTADNLTRHEGGIHTIATFDLGDLQSAKYIKIVDVCDPSKHNNLADGYDLNAVTALQDCVQEETAWGDGLPFPGNNWAMYIEYTVQECEPEEPPPGIEPGDFRTQTQGGWGTGCQGNNPGCYRDDNFDDCFPNGLTVGCSEVHTALFTTSGAIEAFLPQGGKAASFTQDHTDPASTEAGVLAGQVVALTLSVGFDLCDPGFGASDINLKDLIVDGANSPFYNMTVEEVLEEANNLLGDCGSTFTASQINDCVSNINQNFIDGTAVGDFLRLPPLT